MYILKARQEIIKNDPLNEEKREYEDDESIQNQQKESIQNERKESIPYIIEKKNLNKNKKQIIVGVSLTIVTFISIMFIASQSNNSKSTLISNNLFNNTNNNEAKIQLLNNEMQSKEIHISKLNNTPSLINNKNTPIQNITTYNKKSTYNLIEDYQTIINIYSMNIKYLNNNIPKIKDNNNVDDIINHINIFIRLIDPFICINNNDSINKLIDNSLKKLIQDVILSANHIIFELENNLLDDYKAILINKQINNINSIISELTKQINDINNIILKINKE